jgi:hypothetical protein
MTLRESLYALQHCFSLTHRVRLDIQHLHADPSFSPYLLHHSEHETLAITFPRECQSISGFRTNHGCKAVYYVKEGEFIKEVRVEPGATIDVDSTTRVILYTRSKPDLTIWFDMKLIRPMARL